MTDDLAEALVVLGGAASNPGGSGRGVSYWERFHKCAKRGTLGDAMALLGGDDSNEAAAVGTLLHKLAEWWHSGTMKLVAESITPGHDAVFRFPDGVALNPDSAELQEALRVFRYYVQHYAPDAFGEVVAVEMPFAFTEQDSYSPVGVAPFTGRLDMVTRVSPERAAALSERLLFPVHPGIYIIDHKSKASKPSDGELQSYRERIQFHAYMMAWNTLFAAQHGECQGTIANFMVRHKTAAKLQTGESFSQLLVPYPTHDQQQAVRNWFQTAARRKAEEGEMHADPTYCYDYGRMCPHYVNGNCKRY